MSVNKKIRGPYCTFLVWAELPPINLAKESFLYVSHVERRNISGGWAYASKLPFNLQRNAQVCMSVGKAERRTDMIHCPCSQWQSYTVHQFLLSCLYMVDGHDLSSVPECSKLVRSLLSRNFETLAEFKCRREMRSPLCARSASRPPRRSWATRCGPCAGGCMTEEFR